MSGSDAETESFIETKKLLSVWRNPPRSEELVRQSVSDNLAVWLIYPFTPILLPLAVLLDIKREMMA